MKSYLCAFLGSFLALAVAPAQAAGGKSEPAASPDTPVLALVVVESLTRRDSAFTDFDRIDLAFQDIAKQRHWPVKIAAERFAANTAAHDTELRVFLQPIRQELPDEFTFRSWMILSDHGTKHDFGVVVYRYRPRAGQNMDDVLEQIFHGAAVEAARKIEPLLFPQLARSKS